MNMSQSREMDVNVTLDELNDEKARARYGAIVFLGILILPGVIGNLHVLHIYLFKKKNNTTRLFVCCLGLLDFTACAICFPWIIFNHLHPLKMYNDVACKLLSYLAYCLAIGEALALLAIAVERYRKICEPFKQQITLKRARIVCVLIFIFPIVLALPVLFLFGKTELLSEEHPNITGYECNVYKEQRATYLEQLYQGSALFVSASLCIILFVLYLVIGVRIRRHCAKMNKVGEPRTTVENCQGSASNNGNDESLSQEVKRISIEMTSTQPEKMTDQSQSSISTRMYSTGVQVEDNHPSVLRDDVHKPNTKKGRVLIKRDMGNTKKMKQPLYMFFFVTLFYLLSYIPYPVLRLYKTFNKDWYSLSYDIQVAFHDSAICCVLLNNVVNSFIYMIFDAGYRQELKLVYSKLFCRQ